MDWSPTWGFASATGSGALASTTRLRVFAAFGCREAGRAFVFLRVRVFAMRYNAPQRGTFRLNDRRRLSLGALRVRTARITGWGHGPWSANSIMSDQIVPAELLGGSYAASLVRSTRFTAPHIRHWYSL